MLTFICCHIFRVLCQSSAALVLAAYLDVSSVVGLNAQVIQNSLATSGEWGVLCNAVLRSRSLIPSDGGLRVRVESGDERAQGCKRCVAGFNAHIPILAGHLLLDIASNGVFGGAVFHRTANCYATINGFGYCVATYKHPEVLAHNLSQCHKRLEFKILQM